MPIVTRLLVIVLLLLVMKTNAQNLNGKNLFNWKQLKQIPDPDGFAGSYAGVSNGGLLVAGGSNFPGNKRPWTGGTKTWYDKIFILVKEDGDWKEIGRLPKPMGYGVALTYKDGLLCLGGGDLRHNYADVFILRYSGGKIATEKLPSMPAPLINACGVLVDQTVFIAGGIQTPTGLTENVFWSLDMSSPEKKWKILEPVPGTTRMLAAAGTEGGNVYVFGGVHLFAKDTVLQREYLKDCWKYIPGKGWQKVADLPHPLAAAPGPAYNARQSHLVLFGGDDGLNAPKVPELKDQHPGFRNEILAYNTSNNTWSTVGKMPAAIKTDAAVKPGASLYAPVTTPLVIWNNNIVIAGGEARPAVRSNKVLMGTPQKQ